MTKHILVIGNSHIASLKNGWELIKDEYHSQFSLSFLGARRDGIATLQTDQGILYSNDKTVTNSFVYTFGQETVNLTELAPDAILMYGMNMYFPHRFIAECRQNSYSTAVQRVAFQDMLKHTWAYQIIAKIKKIYTGRVFASIPFRAGNADEKMTDGDGAYPLEELNIFANAYFFNTIGIEYITQPISTLNLSTMATLVKYSKGSTRLAVGFENDNEQHSTRDTVHMNADFGALFLRDLFVRL